MRAQLTGLAWVRVRGTKRVPWGASWYGVRPGRRTRREPSSGGPVPWVKRAPRRQASPCRWAQRLPYVPGGVAPNAPKPRPETAARMCPARGSPVAKGRTPPPSSRPRLAKSRTPPSRSRPRVGRSRTEPPRTGAPSGGAPSRPSRKRHRPYGSTTTPVNGSITPVKRRTPPRPPSAPVCRENASPHRPLDAPSPPPAHSESRT
jgi:hypothetical protein